MSSNQTKSDGMFFACVFALIFCGLEIAEVVSSMGSGGVTTKLLFRLLFYGGFGVASAWVGSRHLRTIVQSVK